MLHASFTKRNRKQVVEDGRVKKKSFYDHAMTEEQIEQELDKIFRGAQVRPGGIPIRERLARGRLHNQDGSSILSEA